MRPEPIVQTSDGAVRGRWEQAPGGSAATSAVFRGIPFAAPPTGPRRFAAPAAPRRWEGVRDATRPGATPQRWQNPAPTLIPEPAVPGDETLNLNVFTPRPDAAAALPVLVWFHGGAYVTGSPASPWYDGTGFARDGVVTVVPSYRLGFDGFGVIEGAPHNRGVLDWIAALRWVRQHIGAFGGDPGRVTIAGQSAGGGAVLTLLGLAEAQGLFHGAIALSPAVADVPLARGREIASRLAGILDVPPNREGFCLVDERGIERRQMSATSRSDTPAWRAPIRALRAALTDAVPYGPVIDGALVTRGTLDALAADAGAGSAVPLVIGACDDEFQMVADRYRFVLGLVPASVVLRLAGLRGERLRAYRSATRGTPRVGRGARRALGHYVSDLVFRSLIRRAARAREGARAATWVYRFAWRSRSWGAALHCLDVPFFFDVLGAGGASGERVRALTGPHPPQALADAVHGWAVSFATHGDPGWPAWTSASGTTRVFGEPGAAAIDRDGYAELAALDPEFAALESA